MDKTSKAFLAILILASAILATLYRRPFTRALSLQFDVEKQRILKFQKLSAEIQTKIWNRQNPQNCSDVQLLVYDINIWPCGFGCTSHIILMHFLQAFYVNRTFVLKSKGWSYDRSGWDHYLMPLGKCNYDGKVGSLPVLSDENSNRTIVRSGDKRLYVKYDWKVPRNILERLANIHTDPYAWWIGQFINYELRFQPWFMEILNKRMEKIHFTNHSVGMQVRWGDKIGREAMKHPVSDYVNLASKWFELPENQNVNKTIYVATEQSLVWKNLEDNYWNISFIGSGFVNRNRELDYRKATNYAQRKDELDAILTDLYFLTKCSHVICTFTSNICRLLYEMMAIRKSKPQDSIQSLDQPFYLFWTKPKFRANDGHTAERNMTDIELKIGDIILPSMEIYQRRIHGYVLGTNNRTGLKVQVPKNKLDVVVEPLDVDV